MEKVTMALVLFSILILTPLIHGHEDPKEIEQWFLKVRRHNEKMTRFHFYFHDIPAAGNENPTSAVVAQANMTATSETAFGMVVMMDYPATAQPDLNSKLMARAQGFYASASMKDLGFYMALNIVFTDGVYNGSSLAVMGYNPIRNPYRELEIVGGSGAFRLARGFVIFKTHYVNLTDGGIAILGVDVVALHH